ncbi:PREDICTED: uncharacterized protein LOC108690346 [Atta colombica]|uniref:uncharacterized protein LOC108690346 n=1 Tax=Atta colombica TaxID=520822 RepID=UPI00084BF2AC|nr:PREDICTED: uncharacterized protein LOC108690346 [Atta colombica]
MKGTYLIAILVITLGIALNESLADIPTKCPEINLQNETFFIPHENDCTKFYSCHMGVKGKPIDCPFMDENGNKLHFNPKLQVCDWPWSAGCQTPSSNSTTSSNIPTTITPNTTTSSTPTTPTSTPITTTPSTSTSTTPIPTTPSSPTPTTPTPNTPTPTTPTPSSSIPTTPTTSTPSSSTPTTPTLSSSTSTTPTPSSPTPTTPTPSSPMPTTPTTSTSSSPIPTTSTPSSPTSTTPTPSSSTPTTPTPSSATPTTPTSSSSTPTTPTPSSATPTTSTSSSSTPTTPIPSFPTPPLDSCESDNRTHMLPHETMCDHYYLCFNNWVSPISQKCDRNLLFNSLLRVCDYPENVNCKNSSPNTDKSSLSSISPPFNYSLPTNSDPVAWVCEPNGKYKIPHEIICDYYYWCVNGTRGMNWVRCESNLLFNPVVGECDYSENVNCGYRSTLSPTVPSSTIRITSLITTTLTIPTTTTSTITTLTTTTSTTPTTTTSTTPTTTTSTIPTTTTSTTPTITSTTPTTTTSTTPTTTTSTIPTTTTSTTPTITSTTPTTTTSTTPTTTTSTIPTTTTSTTPTTTTEITITTPTETTTKNPNEPRKKCPPKGSTEKARIAHPCLCNRYYDCIDGEKILQTCPIGKHFDYMREICDWASVVKCIRPIPTFKILTSDIDDYNTTCAPEGRAFQHDTDCSAYYLCSNGEKILRQCMEGLHFNMTIQTCDYPQKSCDLNRSSPRINLDICPPPNSVQEVFLPHECECTQYYECIDGKKFLRFCPNRLHFDPVWQICNDPIEAKCVVDIISTTSTSIFTTSSTTEAIDEPRTTCPPKGSTEKVRLPHPCLCNQYYECVEGDKVLQTCPINMYFDDATNVCDWSTEVKCISQFSSHDIQINDYDNNNNKCSPNGRAFNHEDSCTEYYLCSEGEKVLQYCLEGLHFNVSIQMCDYPQKKCNLNTPGSQPIPTVTLNICPPDSIQQVLLPHECDCTQYYECIDGKQILRDCSDGLHYDYVHQICNVPIKAKCNDFTTMIPQSSFPTIPDSSKCYDENNEIPHENDCRLYYKCNNGEKILKTCPRNLYFNPKLRVCDYPENVACNVEENIPSTSTPIKCKTITETTNIPHETNCNLYYVCDNGVSILKKCSPNLVFNPILKVCDFPENYVCKVTRDKNNIKNIDKIVQNLDPFTCIGTCPEEDPDYAVLLPNDDCKKFCMCSGGVAWIQLCPEPLYFDSVEKICKKKKDAVCGTRLYNQDSSFKIDKIVDNDDSLQPLADENDNERETYDRSLDSSSCIGTCLEENSKHAVLLSNDDCKKFCLCSNGTTYVQPCPELLYFDSIDKACKRKKDAVCAVRSLMFDRIFDDDSVSLSEKDYNERDLYDNPWYKRLFYNVDPSTCIGICPEEDTDYEELLPHKDCRKFCICRKGLTYVQLCPESLYFHSVEKVCRQRRHAVCATNSFKRYHAITNINREDDEDDDEDNSIEFLRENNKRRRHNYLWPHFHNFNPTTCIAMVSCGSNHALSLFILTQYIKDVNRRKKLFAQYIRLTKKKLL